MKKNATIANGFQLVASEGGDPRKARSEPRATHAAPPTLHNSTVAGVCVCAQGWAGVRTAVPGRFERSGVPKGLF